jgi:hypothetical protein
MKRHADLKAMVPLVWAAWFLLLALLLEPMEAGFLLVVGPLMGRLL